MSRFCPNTDFDVEHWWVEVDDLEEVGYVIRKRERLPGEGPCEIKVYQCIGCLNYREVRIPI